MVSFEIYTFLLFVQKFMLSGDTNLCHGKLDLGGGGTERFFADVVQCTIWYDAERQMVQFLKKAVEIQLCRDLKGF